MISLTLEFGGEERFDERSNTFVTLEPCSINHKQKQSAGAEWVYRDKRSLRETPPQKGEELFY